MRRTQFSYHSLIPPPQLLPTNLVTSTLNYEYFYQGNHDPELTEWLNSISPLVEAQSDPSRHGHFPSWLCALHSLPSCATRSTDLNNNRVAAITDATGSDQQELIHTALMKLTPWRKGPFEIDTLFIDSEWRSYLKWDRIKDHISPLANRNVLDVGCGNGYYGYRMIGVGAKTVVGVDPGELFCTQFAAINHFVKETRLAVLPLTGEMVFDNPWLFDTVFSMGVASHRRNPKEHFAGLLSCLRSGGELVLETLVIESEVSETLIPQDRYANMRNVWQLPSVVNLIEQLCDAGFKAVRCVDVCKTTINEQRATPWMPSYSLQNALDPGDPSRTVEGHPAPVRCVVIAQKP